MAFLPVPNQSVSGTVGGSIIGLPPVNVVGRPSISGAVDVSNFPTNQNVSGSVVATQGTNPWIITGSVQASLTPTANQSVSGTVQVDVRGSVAVAIIAGSIAASFTPPANQSVSGTVTTIWQAPSIVGTYAEDAAHTSADRGLLVFGVRNDTTASIVSADIDYTPIAVDSSGRTITKPFAASQSSIFGHGSVNGAASVALIGAPPTGLRNYITDVWVANTGSVATLVNLTAGGGSILGRTIAPAGGGSNIIGLNTPMAVQTGSPFNLEAVTAVSVLYGTAYGYTAQ